LVTQLVIRLQQQIAMVPQFFPDTQFLPKLVTACSILFVFTEKCYQSNTKRSESGAKRAKLKMYHQVL
jgi:hypothetical protein